MRLYLIFFFVLLVTTVFSQNVVLSGSVTDSKTGEIIIGANVWDLSSKAGTSTNKFGFFTLNLKKGETHQVQFSYVGYKTKVIDIQLNADKQFAVSLEIPENSLGEIVIESQKKLEERTETGKINIPVATIRSLPSLMGEADIMKAFQLMPGVQMGAENSNSLFVRGGSADQNLFLLDDVPLYNVNHLGGFFSVFEPSMLKSVDMYKGGFPARYGGRISSVMDIRTKDGNLYKHQGEFSLGILSSKLYLDGPFKSGKSSYALSVRYCNLGIYNLIYSLFNKSSGSSGYYFYDVNLKTNFILSPHNRLFTTFYTGDDNIFYNEKNVTTQNDGYSYSGNSDVKWGNTCGSVRWLHTSESGFFNNTTLSYTGYRFINRVITNARSMITKESTNDLFQSKSAINDVTLKNDAEISLNDHTFRFGLSAISHFFTPGTLTYSHTGPNVDSIIHSSAKIINATNLSSYAEWEHTFFKKLSVNAGFRCGIYAIDGKTYPAFEPRTVVNYLFYPSFSLKASYTRMTQNTHMLSNSDGGLPSDIWVPSTASIKPESADQFSVGVVHTTPKNYELSVELYSKKLRNLIDYKDGILIYDAYQSWESKIETGGVGSAKGIEFLLQKKAGKLTGWVGYTLSSSKRKFEHLNNGKEFPYVYDQTHNISLTGSYQLSKAWAISGVWTFHSGNRITLPSAKYQLANYDYMGNLVYTEAEIYSEKNAYRMPDYHRLDVGLTYIKKLKKGIRKWSLNVSNLYNRQNAYYVFYAKDDDGHLKLYQRSFFPLLFNAAFSYSW